MKQTASSANIIQIMPERAEGFVVRTNAFTNIQKEETYTTRRLAIAAARGFAMADRNANIEDYSAYPNCRLVEYRNGIPGRNLAAATDEDGVGFGWSFRALTPEECENLADLLP